jgi:hypothetical protein
MSNGSLPRDDMSEHFYRFADWPPDRKTEPIGYLSPGDLYREQQEVG